MNKYQREHEQFKEKLRQKLQEYQSELKASQEELSTGLGISRQSLFNFLRQKKKSLPIERINLINLWEYLTSPETIDKKKEKLSNQAIENRELLRQEGFDQLLLSAGFVPNLSRCYSVSPVLLPQDELVNWGENLENKLDKWWEKYPDFAANIKPKLKDEMSRICSSGVNEFYDCEIHELAQCLSEQQKFYEQFYHINFDWRVVSCSFNSITFSIEDYINNPQLKEVFCLAMYQAESYFRQIFLKIQGEPLDLPPVIKVSIKSKLIGNQSESVIYWHSISDKTHLENAFSAVAKGMGYHSILTVKSNQIWTLGEKENSLVKGSTILVSRDKNHQLYEGIWIDRSTIDCGIKSTVFAATNWLFNYLKKSSDFKNYIDICTRVSKIENNLNNCRKILDGYLFDSLDNRRVKDLSEVLKKDVIEEIQVIQWRYKDSEIYKMYKHDLYCQYCTAYWLLARSSNVQGILKDAKQYMEEMKNNLNEIKDYTPLQILYEVEEVVLQFFCGDSDFLKTRNNWLEKQESWRQQLQDYIKKENPNYGHLAGGFDLNIYACASEIFGRVGRLDMRFDYGDISVLENGIKNLLMAAYCSSRIGHLKKLAHWFVNASRSYCRIGEKEKAEQLADLAQRIIKKAMNSISPEFSDEYRKSVMAETNLAFAEKYLLIDKNHKKSLKYFFEALKGSIYLRFARIISESLYGISRASENLELKEFNEIFKEIFKDLDQLKNKSDTKNPIIKNIVDFLFEVHNIQDINSISNQFKNYATEIWDKWDTKGNHPISKMMKEGIFLNNLVPKALTSVKTKIPVDIDENFSDFNEPAM